MLALVLLLACASPGSSDDASSDTAAQPQPSYDIPDFPAGVSTLAGSDTMASIDGLGTAAAFSEPKTIALRADGVLVVVGGDGQVRTVEQDGMVQTLSYSGAALSDAGGLAIDADGAIYVSDPQQHCIVRIEDGVGDVFAGTCGTPGMAEGSSALLMRPRGLTFDGAGNLLVADSENMRIRSISPDGVVSTLAGIDSFSAPTEGSVSSASLYFPIDIAVHASGDIYFSGLDNCIRRIRDDQVENMAGLCQNYSSDGSEDGAPEDARFYAPFDITFADTEVLIISDSFNDRIRLYSIEEESVSTLSGSSAGYLDGSLDEALYEIPRAVAVDRQGNLFVADSINHRIRVVSP